MRRSRLTPTARPHRRRLGRPPFLYEIDLTEQGGPGVHTKTDQGPATGVDTRLGVTAPNPWRLVLSNGEVGFGTTPMTVTIGWP